ncbi:MAG: hypothetical protein HYW48_06610 [Deltaproteobacteria bacterium]|nr:hypothetical protein [Deltaproteobacteria bacterium]
MVKRVEDIRSLIDRGEFEEAQTSLDGILELGPRNLEALKLKAFLYSCQGRFEDEASTWRKIIEVDPEDEAAMLFFHKSFIEEREREYFTDLLPSGARRFLAHPRNVINASFLGLIGCAIFLSVSNLARKYIILTTPLISFLLFLLLVGVPWVVIFVAYFRSIRDVTIGVDGILVRTRTKSYALRWKDVNSFYIVHRAPPGLGEMSLVFVPERKDQEMIEIEIGENSVIRAPSFFLREVVKVFQEPVYSSRESLPWERRAILSF